MANQQPTFRAYTVIKRGDGQDDFWLAIGAAFAHSAGPESGLNVVLQALPLPDKDGQCKIVLRPPKSDEDNQGSQGHSDRSDNKSGSRRR
jgi:hypothetical protein